MFVQHNTIVCISTPCTVITPRRWAYFRELGKCSLRKGKFDPEHHLYRSVQQPLLKYDSGSVRRPRKCSPPPCNFDPGLVPTVFTSFVHVCVAYAFIFTSTPVRLQLRVNPEAGEIMRAPHNWNFDSELEAFDCTTCWYTYEPLYSYRKGVLQGAFYLASQTSAIRPHIVCTAYSFVCTATPCSAITRWGWGYFQKLGKCSSRKGHFDPGQVPIVCRRLYIISRRLYNSLCLNMTQGQHGGRGNAPPTL